MIHRAPEFCVVGGGLAGLTIASRIAAAGRRVVVLESGGREPAHQPARGGVVVTDDRHSGTSKASYRGLGGASAYWGGRLIPLTDHDLQARPHIGIAAWPLRREDLSCHTAEIESLFRIDHSSFECAGRSKGNLCQQGDAEVVRRFPKAPLFANRNLADALTPQFNNSANVEIWLNATVDDIRLDPDCARIAGIVATSPNGKTINVQAGIIFLAAGTFESTRLCLYIDRLTYGRAFARCTALGSFFQEHLRVEIGRLSVIDPFATNRLFGQRQQRTTRRSIHFELSPEVQKRESVASAYLDIRMVPAEGSALASLHALGKRRQGQDKHTPILSEFGAVLDPGFLARAAYCHLRYRQVYFPPDVSLYADIRIEQIPQRRNRLYLAEQSDALGMPQLVLEWAPRDLEERTFRVASRIFKDYWQRSGLEKTCPVIWPDEDNGVAAPFIARCEDTLHPSGSTRMGVEPAFAVVDPFLRCHHIENLSIVSASTFPSSGSANPSLTLLQLALRASDFRLRQ